MANLMSITGHGQSKPIVTSKSISVRVGDRRITIAVVDNKAATVVSEPADRKSTKLHDNGENKSSRRKTSRRSRNGNTAETATFVHVLRRRTAGGHDSISVSGSSGSAGGSTSALGALWDDRRYQFRRDSAPMTAAQAAAVRTPFQRAIVAHPVISQFFRECINGGGLIPIDFDTPIDYFAGVCTVGLPGHAGTKNTSLEEFAICGAHLTSYASVRGRAIVLPGAVIRDHATIGDDAFVDSGSVVTTRVFVGGDMSILGDASGAPVLRGDFRIVGNFNLVGSGHLSTGGATMIDNVEQVEQFVRFVMGHTR